MDNFRDILITEGVNSKGFGTISKLVMLDRKLTIQAKAIYAYFCSYAGGGSQPFPSVERILGDLDISEDTYYKHLRFLKAYGYIIVEQRKNGKGTFLSNVYTLTSHPVPNLEMVEQLEKKKINKKRKNVVIEHDIEPSPKNQGAGEDEPSPKFPCTDLPCTEKSGTNINKSFYNINKSFITTTENKTHGEACEDKKNVVVDDSIDINNLKTEVDSTTGGNVNLKVLHKLLNKQGIEKIQYCLQNWAGIVGSQKIGSVESFFVTAVEQEYRVQTQGRPSTVATDKSNRSNFEQREYPDEYFDSFFSNVSAYSGDGVHGGQNWDKCHIKATD